MTGLHVPVLIDQGTCANGSSGVTMVALWGKLVKLQFRLAGFLTQTYLLAVWDGEHFSVKNSQC